MLIYSSDTIGLIYSRTGSPVPQSGRECRKEILAGASYFEDYTTGPLTTRMMKERKPIFHMACASHGDRLAIYPLTLKQWIFWPAAVDATDGLFSLGTTLFHTHVIQAICHFLPRAFISLLDSRCGRRGTLGSGRCRLGRTSAIIVRRGRVDELGVGPYPVFVFFPFRS